MPELFLELFVVPLLHGFELVGLLKVGVNAEMRSIAFDLNQREVLRWIDHRGNCGAAFLEKLDVINGIWEVAQDELVERWLTAIDNFLQHSDDKIGGDVLPSCLQLIELNAEVRLPLIISSLNLGNVKIDEVVLCNQAFDHVVAEF